MKRQPEIVSIGQGLCRLTVRTRKQRNFYTRIPGVRIDDRDAEYLGYRVLFPEKMRGLIESTLRKERRKEKPPQPVQAQLVLPEKQREDAGGQGSKSEGEKRKPEGKVKSKQREGA